MSYDLTHLTPVQLQIYSNCKMGQPTEIPRDQVDIAVIDGSFISFILLGGLEFEDGSLPSLKLKGARVRGTVNLEGAETAVSAAFEECLFEEELIMRHSRTKRFSFSACHVNGISASGLRVDGDFEFCKGSLSNGAINMEGSTVDGQLRLEEATIYAPNSSALLLSRARINGSILAAKMVVTGQVRLISCRVDGLLSLRAARVEHTTGSAIAAERAVVGESLFFQRDFVAHGNVAFDNAVIGGGIDCTGSKFQHGQKRLCLNLGRAKVGRNISFKDASFRGNVRLLGVAATGSIRFDGAEFVGTDCELNLNYSNSERLHIDFKQPPSEILLRYSTHTILQDGPTSWPKRIALRGFAYKALEDGGATSVGQRLEWLATDIDSYTPQPYEQLATILRAAGDDVAARTVSLAKQRQRRKTLRPLHRIPGATLDVLVGYGYRNWYAGLWLILVLAVSSAALYRWPPTPGAGAEGQPVHPILLALDLILPIVDLGQEKNWIVSPPINWLPSTLVLVGWVLTTAVVAGLARVLNRST